MTPVFSTHDALLTCLDRVSQCMLFKYACLSHLPNIWQWVHYHILPLLLAYEFFVENKSYLSSDHYFQRLINAQYLLEGHSNAPPDTHFVFLNDVAHFPLIFIQCRGGVGWRRLKKNKKTDWRNKMVIMLLKIIWLLSGVHFRSKLLFYH